MVTVSAPLQREVTDWDEYVGRFEAIQDVEIRPRVSGTVTAIHFREGQDVRRGQLLFEIDRRPFVAALNQARAEAARAAAAAANASSELTRAQSLQAIDAISREEFEAKEAAARAANASVTAARAAVAMRELDLQFSSVRSPIGGRISERRVSLGSFVQAGETTLTRVVMLNPIWFSFDGSEAFYLKYTRLNLSGARGSSRTAPNPVDIQLADESRYNWRGRMVFVDNALNPRSGTIAAKAEVANPDGTLTPGMFGRARLLGSGTYQAMLVPAEAIVTDQDRRVVYVVGRDNKIVVRVVETGPMVEGLRVVRTGLTANDRVVLNGLNRVQPGSVVTTQMRPIRPRANADTPVSQPVTAPAAAEATVR